MSVVLVPLYIARAVGCESSDCRFRMLGSQRTTLVWYPVYDRFGKPQGHDPNKTTTSWDCTTCGMQFKVVTQEGHDPEVVDWRR